MCHSEKKAALFFTSIDEATFVTFVSTLYIYGSCCPMAFHLERNMILITNIIHERIQKYTPDIYVLIWRV
jgi:hypothetical protein